MVLRKPYKFFIKHFKLFHVFLSAFIIYSIFRITSTVSFINDYLASNKALITMDDVRSVYKVSDFVVPILTLVFLILLLVVMTIKKKQNKFYALGTLATSVYLIVNIYGYSTLKQLTTIWLDVNRLSSLGDIYIFVMIALMIEAAVTLSRAIGFNVSRFDFNSDLAKFDLSEEDNAEFEVVVDFDINDLKRDAQKNIRYVKYFLKENRSTLLVTISAFILAVGLYLGFSFIKNAKKIVKTNILQYNGFKFEINNSYIVNTDLNGKELDDNLYLVVIDANVTNESKKIDSIFKTGTLTINIGNERYKSTTKYGDYLKDLGTIYLDEKIKKEGTVRRLFVFEVPVNHIHSKILLGVRDLNAKSSVYKKIKPVNLNGDDKVIEANLGDSIEFKDSSLNNISFKFDKYDMEDKYAINYTYCYQPNQCIDSIEYLVANNSSYNYDRTILKLEGSIDINNSTVDSFYNMISKYGYIEYTKEGKIYRQTNAFKELKSTKIEQKNTYYIEIDKDIKDADTIYIGFKIRNYDYKYYLKGRG